jgi:phosphoglycerol transferase MdoB-like AlkP superfamily enzyme
MSTQSRGGGWRLAGRLLEGTARIIVLFIGYLLSVLPIYFWPFSLFIGFVLLFPKRTRKHGIAMIVLTVVINAIFIVLILSGRGHHTIGPGVAAG